MIYDNLSKNASITTLPPKFNITFIRQPKVEIIDSSGEEFNVKFFNHTTNQSIYETSLKGGMWGAASKQYYIKWRIEIYDSKGKLIEKHIYDCYDKKVYIHLSSKAVGDTLCWFPYLEEFRKIHNCKLAVSTFHNEWFESLYPDIEFVKPGTNVTGLYAMYEIGWFFNSEDKFDNDRHPKDPKLFPLQQTSSDILGLPFKNLKPNVFFTPTPLDITGKYITIGPHASAHAKYWNYTKGWQTLIDWAHSEGYQVVNCSQEKLGDEWHDSKLGGTLTNVIDKSGCSLDEAFTLIKNSSAFVGVSSGLSWISWALNTPSVLISGFTEPFMENEEFYRVYTPQGICRGCQTTERLDPGDWEWCPFHKNTFRHFECTKSITPESVIVNLKKALNIYH